MLEIGCIQVIFSKDCESLLLGLSFVSPSGIVKDTNIERQQANLEGEVFVLKA